MKTLAFLLLLGAATAQEPIRNSGTVQATEVTAALPTAHFAIVVNDDILISGEGDGWSFKLYRDGRLESTGSYHPSAAALEFWKEMSKAVPQVCEVPKKSEVTR